MKLRVDVAVVGASLAGSTLAYILGKSGISVALIDKAAFPRRKACGEGLSNFGALELSLIGIDHLLSEIPHDKYNGFTLWKGGAPHLISPHNCASLGFGVQRLALDMKVLLEACKFPSVVPYLAQRVLRITRHDCKYRLTLLNGEVEARALVLAHGALGNPGAEVGVKKFETNTQRYGASAHFMGEFYNHCSRVNIIVRPGFEIYCTPTGAGTLNVALLGKKELLNSLRDNSFNSMLKEELQQKIGFTGERIEDFLATGPIGHVSEGSRDSNIIIIGDAREQLDPIGGMGISHALICARLAGAALRKHFIEHAPLQHVTNEYELLRAKTVNKLRGFTRLTYFGLIAMPPGKLSSFLLQSSIANRIAKSVHGSQTKRGGFIASMIHSIGAIL